MRILAILLKDLLQILRDKRSALFLVLMPILFTMVFGAAFSANASSDSRLPVGWINLDPAGVQANSLYQILDRSETVRLVILDGQESAAIDKMVREGKVAAVVIVPQGFGSPAPASRAAKPTLVVLPNTPAGVAASSAIQSSIKRVLGAIEIARISANAGEPAPAASNIASSDPSIQEAFTIAMAAWKQPALGVKAESPTTSQPKQTLTAQGFVQASPGMMVQFAVFGLVTSAMILVLERKTQTLKRMLTTPTPRTEIIAGHLLAMFGVGFFQTAMLVLLGQFAFGVNYLREPIGTLFMMVTLSLWAASLGLLISAICKKEEQVVLVSLIAMFVLAAFGGCWFPLAIAGESFAMIGHVMPTAWAMDGLQNIVLRGLGWSSTMLPACMLLAYTAAFFTVAVWRFKFE